MNIIKKIILSLVLLTAFFGASVPAFAADDWCAGWSEGIIKCPTDEISFREYTGQLVTLSPEGYDPALTQTSSVREFVQKVVNYALSFLGFIAILLVIYGGFLYLTAAGETEKTEKGKKTIGYAAVGILLILGSYAIVSTILTGPFRGGGGSEGEMQGWEASGFGASTSSIVTSAENLLKGYKFVYESTEAFKTLTFNANKESMKTPDKSMILQYLNEFKSRLQDLKYKAPNFSKVTGDMNDAIRYIDGKIDKMKMTKNEIQVTKTEDKDEGWLKEKIGEGWFGMDTDYNYEETVINNIQTEWKAIKDYLVPNNAGSESIIHKLQETIKTDFTGKTPSEFANVTKENLESMCQTQVLGGVMGEQLCLLGGVYGEIEGMETFKETKIPSLYTDLISSFGTLANNVSLIDIPKYVEGINDVGLAESNAAIVKIIKTEDSLVKEIKNIKFVKTVLVADIVQGTAPLIVHFNVLNSADPSGDAIKPEDIHWRMMGGTEYDKNAECFNKFNPESGGGESTKEVIGGFTNYCVYTKPGTYRVSVKIDSNAVNKNTNKKIYASGISTLDIKVLPPKTMISLKAKFGKEDVSLVDYTTEGFLTVSRDYLTITEDEAKGKITFDASGTSEIASQKIASYKWDFGDGEIIENGTGIVEYGYDNKGSYTVTLTVKKVDGDEARKIFNVIVGSPAARIDVVPGGKIKVNQTVTFDGSKSSTSMGQIKSYDWVATKESESGGDANKMCKESADKRQYYCAFTEPAKYTVSLTVTDNLGKSSTTYTAIEIESEPPVPIYSYKIPDPTQPSKVYFDASKTYDPDGPFENIKFTWKIDPPPEPGVVDFVADAAGNPTDASSVKPVVLFGKAGDYTVALEVEDGSPNQKTGKVEGVIKIENTLDIDWGKSQKITGVLDNNGEAKMQFKFTSNKGVAYEINFGDGETESGQFETKDVTVEHAYKTAGKYEVKVSAYDVEDNSNEIKRKVFIGGGDKPVAKISFFVNGEEYVDFEEPLKISRADTIAFDASESKNMDGTGKDLKYSWDFGDGGKSSKKTVYHKYNELSPKAPGYFKLKLKVYDKDEEEKFDEETLKIDVIALSPKFSSLQAVPQDGSSLTTPVNVNVKLYGAVDPDGQITQYKWWYYDINSPDEILGMQITQSASAIVTIGTKGSEGQEKTYGFGVEITDNDNTKVNSEDELEKSAIPTLKVKNGPNAAPIAKFNVDRTKIFAGESVNFSSASSDPDGKIAVYIWDFEGDGFFNDKPTTLSTISRTYDEKNLNGIQVKLKVVDDKSGEAISQPVTIFVDSNAKIPKAAFKAEVISGKTVKFTSNSEADKAVGAEIKLYRWDFDTVSPFASADTDGNGKKDDDNDSDQKDPEFTYDEYGIYQVKLTVKDTQGNENSVTNTVSVSAAAAPLAAGSSQSGTAPSGAASSPGSFGLPPQGSQGGLGTEPGAQQGATASNLKAAFVTSPLPDADGVIRLTGTSGSVTFDFSKSEGSIAYYIFDKNINFDTNKNGIPNDEEDFKTSLPGKWTTNFDKSWGKIVVKLTVVDIQGNVNSTVQEIAFK